MTERKVDVMDKAGKVLHTYPITPVSYTHLGGSRHSLRRFANEMIPEFNCDRAAGRGNRLSLA